MGATTALLSPFGARHRCLPGLDLRCVLRQLGPAFAMTLRRSDDFHFLPVIRELFAAIETSDISSRQRCCLRSSLCASNGYRKAVPRVPAAEQSVQQFFNHDPPSIPERCMSESWVFRVLGLWRDTASLPLSAALPLFVLDSPIAKRVEVFLKPGFPGGKSQKPLS